MEEKNGILWVGLTVVVLLLAFWLYLAFNKKEVETPKATFIIGEEPAPVVVEQIESFNDVGK